MEGINVLLQKEIIVYGVSDFIYYKSDKIIFGGENYAVYKFDYSGI